MKDIILVISFSILVTVIDSFANADIGVSLNSSQCISEGSMLRLSCLGYKDTQLWIRQGFYAWTSRPDTASRFCENPQPDFKSDCMTDPGGDRWSMAAQCNTFSSCTVYQQSTSVHGCGGQGMSYAFVNYVCLPKFKSDGQFIDIVNISPKEKTYDNLYESFFLETDSYAQPINTTLSSCQITISAGIRLMFRLLDIRGRSVDSTGFNASSCSHNFYINNGLNVYKKWCVSRDWNYEELQIPASLQPEQVIDVVLEKNTGGDAAAWILVLATKEEDSVGSKIKVVSGLNVQRHPLPTGDMITVTSSSVTASSVTASSVTASSVTASTVTVSTVTPSTVTFSVTTSTTKTVTSTRTVVITNSSISSTSISTSMSSRISSPPTTSMRTTSIGTFNISTGTSKTTVSTSSTRASNVPSSITSTLARSTSMFINSSTLTSSSTSTSTRSTSTPPAITSTPISSTSSTLATSSTSKIISTSISTSIDITSRPTSLTTSTGATITTISTSITPTSSTSSSMLSHSTSSSVYTSSTTKSFSTLPTNTIIAIETTNQPSQSSSTITTTTDATVNNTSEQPSTVIIITEQHKTFTSNPELSTPKETATASEKTSRTEILATTASVGITVASAPATLSFTYHQSHKSSAQATLIVTTDGNEIDGNSTDVRSSGGGSTNQTYAVVGGCVGGILLLIFLIIIGIAVSRSRNSVNRQHTKQPANQKWNMIRPERSRPVHARPDRQKVSENVYDEIPETPVQTMDLQHQNSSQLRYAQNNDVRYAQNNDVTTFNAANNGNVNYSPRIGARWDNHAIRERVEDFGIGSGYPGQQISYPGQQIAHPGQEIAHPGQQISYPGQQVAYPGQQVAYSGQQRPYPGQQQQPYTGQQQPYPGQQRYHSQQNVMPVVNNAATFNWVGVTENDVGNSRGVQQNPLFGQKLEIFMY